MTATNQEQDDPALANETGILATPGARWLFEATTMPLALLNADLRVIRANPAFLAQCAYQAQELSGLHLRDLFAEEIAARLQRAFARGERPRQEVLLRMGDGGQKAVRLEIDTFIPADGEPLHLLLCTDLSDRQELLERIREGRHQLRRSSRLASLGEMVAGIGHELTQPLNAILLFARNCLKILDQAPANESMLRENLGIIVDRANRASSTIQIMRGFARLEKEQGRRPVEINLLLRKILHFLDPQLRLGEIELELCLSEQPCVVNALEVSLEQVFFNIMQNAIQAMGRVETPRLRVSTGQTRGLDLKTTLHETYIMVKIADNGEGMSKEVRKKIFDPFFTTREAGIGTGLGLSIVDRIIRGFSGYIEVEGEEGQGSVFTIFIPRYEQAEDGKRQ